MNIGGQLSGWVLIARTDVQNRNTSDRMSRFFDPVLYKNRIDETHGSNIMLYSIMFKSIMYSRFLVVLSSSK